MKKLYEHSATELAAMLRAKEVSAVEITKATLGRIEEVENKVDAFLTVTAEQALQQAQQVDETIAGGKPLARLRVSRSPSKTIFAPRVCARPVRRACLKILCPLTMQPLWKNWLHRVPCCRAN